MPWRNPATGLFESGHGPVDRRVSNVNPFATQEQAPEAPQAQQPARGGDIHGGWDKVIQTPDHDPMARASLGDYVQSVADVLADGQAQAGKDTGQGGKNYADKKSDHDDVVGG